LPFQNALGRTDLAAFDDLPLGRLWCYLRDYVSSSRRPFTRICDDRSCRAVFQALPVIFIRTRYFSVSDDGLVFIGIGIGAVLASIVNLWFLRSYPHLLEQWYKFTPAEEHLYSDMVPRAERDPHRDGEHARIHLLHSSCAYCSPSLARGC
jgi:hypothetical protein